MTPPPSSDQRQRAQRATGLAMMGSAMALVVLAALTWAGVMPFDASIRGWAAAGIGMAGALDGLLGAYFLRASSQP